MELYSKRCPFCGDGTFDAIGLCIHLNGGCNQYDHACRLTSEYVDRCEAREQKEPTNDN